MAAQNANVETLTKYILEYRGMYMEERHELALLFSALQQCCKITGNAMKRAGLENLLGSSGTTNVHLEEVKKLDLIANEAFKAALTQSNTVCVMASEEEVDPIPVPASRAGKFCLTFDPLDGSSNIDANVSVGSIFGIYRRLEGSKVGTPGDAKDVLRAGKEMCGSGYALYGSSIVMVVCIGAEVNGFTYDPSLGEFILSHPNIKVPVTGSIYSVNEGNSLYWEQSVRDYVTWVKGTSPHPYSHGGEAADGSSTPGRSRARDPYSSRYIGSMVADVHRTLLYGGIFMYPADSRNPMGKLRYLYEVAPLSYILEKAGGRAIIGNERMGLVDALEYKPEDIHCRTPVFMGSEACVDDLKQFFEKPGKSSGALGAAAAGGDESKDEE